MICGYDVLSRTAISRVHCPIRTAAPVGGRGARPREHHRRAHRLQRRVRAPDGDRSLRGDRRGAGRARRWRRPAPAPAQRRGRPVGRHPAGGHACPRASPAGRTTRAASSPASARAGLVAPALDALVISDVPLGGGLSSSAAFEVATATLLETALGKTLEPTEKARLCRQAEHDYARVPVRDHGPADLRAGRRGGRVADRLPVAADAAGAVRGPVGVAADRQQQRPPFAGRRRLRGADVGLRGGGAEAGRRRAGPGDRRDGRRRRAGAGAAAVPARAPRRERERAHARGGRRAGGRRLARGGRPDVRRATSRCATTTRSAPPSSTRWSSWRPTSASRAASTARA